jgi:hypothetical protein
MKRHELEHILRASAAITGADRFIVIGSEAIHGQFPNLPPDVTRSVEADVFSPRSHAETELIEGSIGEGSPFHVTFGYYAHGVAEETATLPRGWKDRLVPMKTPNTGGATGLCLEVHDLAVSKLIAGRDKDIDYLRSLLRHRLMDLETLGARLAETPLDEAVRAPAAARLDRLAQTGP